MADYPSVENFKHEKDSFYEEKQDLQLASESDYHQIKKVITLSKELNVHEKCFALRRAWYANWCNWVVNNSSPPGVKDNSQIAVEVLPVALKKPEYNGMFMICAQLRDFFVSRYGVQERSVFEKKVIQRSGVPFDDRHSKFAQISEVKVGQAKEVTKPVRSNEVSHDIKSFQSMTNQVAIGRGTESADEIEILLNGLFGELKTREPTEDRKYLSALFKCVFELEKAPKDSKSNWREFNDILDDGSKLKELLKKLVVNCLDSHHVIERFVTSAVFTLSMWIAMRGEGTEKDNTMYTNSKDPFFISKEKQQANQAARESAVKRFLGTLGWAGVMVAISLKAQEYCMSCLRSAAKFCDADGRGSTEKFFWKQGIISFSNYDNEDDYWTKLSNVPEKPLEMSQLDVLPHQFVHTTKELPSVFADVISPLLTDKFHLHIKNLMKGTAAEVKAGPSKTYARTVTKCEEYKSEAEKNIKLGR